MAAQSLKCRTWWTWALMSILGASPVLAESRRGCDLYSGELNTVALLPPACTSPIGLCTTGRFSGELNAQFDFRADQMSPLSGWQQVVMEYTGAVTLTIDAQNVLFIQNGGLINMNPNSSGSVQDVGIITGGTGAYAAAAGSVRIVGTFDFATGTGHSKFHVWLCLP